MTAGPALCPSAGPGTSSSGLVNIGGMNETKICVIAVILLLGSESKEVIQIKSKSLYKDVNCYISLDGKTGNSLSASTVGSGGVNSEISFEKII